MPKPKHAVLKEFLPWFVGLLLVGVVFLSPLDHYVKFSKAELNQFAESPSIHSTFIGYSIKAQAFSQANYLPVLGSSELEKLDPFHLSVFSQKYKTSYTPFLAGQPGTQSLPLYFYVNSVQSELKNRKMVFIISPQWFTQKGLTSAFATNFISKGEIYNWIQTSDPKKKTTQLVAQRLIELKLNQGDSLINDCLKKMAKGKPVGEAEMVSVEFFNTLWRRQDFVFSHISGSMLANQQAAEVTSGNISNQNASTAINTLSQQLPDRLNFSNLYNLAEANGKLNSSNNPFNIRNAIYNAMTKNGLKKRKDTQIKTSYLQSPEYSDFQVMLNEFAENHDQVLFIIQPVNGAWYKYTGLSMPMLKQFSEKITKQLKSQGFNNIDDMTNLYNQPYYIGDTIHLGDKGWVNVDQAIENFMKSDVPKSANYQINNAQYLSTNWNQSVTSK